MGKSVIFLAPIRAFYARDLYVDVARRWRGLAFLYLAFLLAICWVPSTVGMYRGLAAFIAADGNGVISQIPTITIANGQVSTDVEEPHFIRATTGKEPFGMIIDTTGQITSLEGQDAQILLMRDRMILKKSSQETRMYDLSKIESFSFDEDRVRGWLRFVGTWGPLFLFPFAVVSSLVYRVLQALLYSGVAALLAKWMGVRLPYGALLALTIVALTPTILAKTVLDLAGATFPFRWLVLFGLSMAYVAFAVRSNKEQNQPAAVPVP